MCIVHGTHRIYYYKACNYIRMHVVGDSLDMLTQSPSFPIRKEFIQI